MFLLSVANWKIFIASFIAFVILNTFENVLHYNIGRTSDEDEIVVLSNPTPKDWIRILIVMLVFAILQGLFTILIRSYE